MHKQWIPGALSPSSAPGFEARCDHTFKALQYVIPLPLRICIGAASIVMELVYHTAHGIAAKNGTKCDHVCGQFIRMM